MQNIRQNNNFAHVGVKLKANVQPPNTSSDGIRRCICVLGRDFTSDLPIQSEQKSSHNEPKHLAEPAYALWSLPMPQTWICKIFVKSGSISGVAPTIVAVAIFTLIYPSTRIQRIFESGPSVWESRSSQNAAWGCVAEDDGWSKKIAGWRIWSCHRGV